jgi:dTDP-4-dehydrorhamnose reductase
MQQERVIILGGSGFLGYALYKELCPYFDTYATFHTGRHSFNNNQKFRHFSLVEESVYPLLEEIAPTVIISALRGDFKAQIRAHEEIAHYVQIHRCTVYFLSTANVFDAYSRYPSYEGDQTLSQSKFGHLKIKIENILKKLPSDKFGILRVPMVFGSSSPRVKEIKSALLNQEPIEVFPNLIINVTNDDKLCQQVHYLINRQRTGIFHLGSIDLVHHEDFIRETIRKMGNFHPIIKRVYTTNHDRYLAVIPRDNKLPENLTPTFQEIIDGQLAV